MPKRVDQNQPEIVAALRAAGATVTPTHMIGHGFPDLAVGWYDRGSGRYLTTLIEVKMPKGKLTPDELSWMRAWGGAVSVVHSVAEALEVIGIEATPISRFERNVAQTGRRR